MTTATDNLFTAADHLDVLAEQQEREASRLRSIASLIRHEAREASDGSPVE